MLLSELPLARTMETRATEAAAMPLGEASALAIAAGRPVGDNEALALGKARGRVLVSPLAAGLSLPLFDNSAMDGYALAGPIHRDVAYRLVGRATAGEPFSGTLRPGEAIRILTGAVVPAGVSAILRQEDAELGPSAVRCRHVPEHGANIRRAGEDVMPGDRVVRAGTRLDARHVAMLAGLGVASVRVRRRVRVAVLSTGSELREPGEMLGDGAIYDGNRAMLLALLDRPDVEIIDGGLVPDSPLALADRLFTLAECADLVVTSGGVSGGDADFLRSATLRAGGSIETLTVALKPGRPLGLGRVGGAILVGLPGNPLAALAAFLFFARPLVGRLSGASEQMLPLRDVVAGFGRTADPRRTELVAVRVTGEDGSGRTIVEPVGPTGAARLRPLLEADGFCVVPPRREAIVVGDRVPYLPFFESILS